MYEQAINKKEKYEQAINGKKTWAITLITFK